MDAKPYQAFHEHNWIERISVEQKLLAHYTYFPTFNLRKITRAIQYFWDKEGDQIIDKEGTELSSDVFTVINKIIAFSNAWTSKSDWLALHDISKR